MEINVTLTFFPYDIKYVKDNFISAIGAKNKGASNKEMALMVLNEFRDNGLWVGVQQADGLYKVQKKRITQEQYDAALKELNKKGNNGLNKE